VVLLWNKNGKMPRKKNMQKLEGIQENSKETRQRALCNELLEYTGCLDENLVKNALKI
jgi:hypothetical protein